MIRLLLGRAQGAQALPRAFGADLELVPSAGGTVTPALFDRFKARMGAHQVN